MQEAAGRNAQVLLPKSGLITWYRVFGHYGIGPFGMGTNRSTLREAGTRNILACMENSKVSRLVSQSSLGVGDSRSNLGFFTNYIIVSIFLRH